MTALLATTSPALATALLTRADFVRGLEIAKRVAAKRNAVPMLCNVRLRGDGAALFITATDSDIEIDVRVPGAADAAFDVTVPAQLLHQLANGAPVAVEYVALTAPVWGSKLPNQDHRTGKGVLEMDAVRSEIACLHPEGFPGLKPVTFSHHFTMTGAELFEALDSVAFAMSEEETRYYLNGVYMHNIAPNKVATYHGSHGDLLFVATDGHRLAKHRAKAPAGSIDVPGAILPSKLVTLLARLLKGKAAPATVDIEVCADRVRFALSNGVTITSKVIEGTFPDYERTVPKRNDKIVRVDLAPFAAALKHLKAMTGPRTGSGVKFTMTAPGEMVLSFEHPEHGQAATPIPARFEFDTFEIGFNVRYLVDIADHLAGPEIIMEFGDAGAPAVFRAADSPVLHVQMPMRV